MPTQAWVHRARYLGPSRPQAGRGAARQGGPRAARHPGAAARPPRARAGRERVVEPDRDPRRDPPRPRARDRRRDHDLAAELDPSRRRRREARDGRALGRRPARLRRRPRPPALGERGRAGEGEGRRRRREARRALGRRDRLRRRTSSPTRCARSSRAAASLTIPNGSDFDDFDGLAYTPGARLRITHTGSFFGKRDPRPFLQALHDSGARRRRALPRRLPQRRPRVGRAGSASATGSS